MKRTTCYFRSLTKVLLFSGTISVLPVAQLYASTGADPLGVTFNQQQLSGTVKDAKGEPVPGVTVSVKGSTMGTSTDVNGQFILQNIPEGSVLVVSMIGYLNQEVTVTGSMVDITLQEDAQGLDEVVVVGYGSVDKKELTSAVTTLRQDDLIAGAPSPLMSMQGKVAGLNVNSSNGTDPNSNVTLQLRGVNSVNASQGPLVVIDGVPGGNVNSVAKEDIESISVLRDASAAAIYGTRASGGVILITTKRPQIGKAVVSLTSEFFVESIRKRPEVLSGDRFVEVGLGEDLGHRTDWYDEVTNDNPFSHRQVLNISGGSENANVYATVNKRDAKGMAIGSKRDEIGGRVNSNFKFFDGFAELSTNVSYNQVNSDFANNDVFNMAMVLNPTETPYDA